MEERGEEKEKKGRERRRKRVECIQAMASEVTL